MEDLNPLRGSLTEARRARPVPAETVFFGKRQDRAGATSAGPPHEMRELLNVGGRCVENSDLFGLGTAPVPVLATCVLSQAIGYCRSVIRFSENFSSRQD